MNLEHYKDQKSFELVARRTNRSPVVAELGRVVSARAWLQVEFDRLHGPWMPTVGAGGH